MITTDFAPNESWDDALLSLKLLFQPWVWKSGNATEQVKKAILKQLTDDQNFKIRLFLSGRSALYNYIKCLNLPKRSEILVQAFTCEAVVLPILANNLKPVYIDIEAYTYSIHPIDLAKKIGPKSKVLILQHTFGLTPNRKKEILALVRKHKLLLIEDIAHKLKYIASDSSNQTDAYLLSFGRSKALSSVFGGTIVTKNTKMAQKLGAIEQNLPYQSITFLFLALLYKPFAMLIKSTYDVYLGKIIHFLFNKLGLLIGEITKKERVGEYDSFFDKKYPNCLAILLLHQLNKYQTMQKQREIIGKIYNSKLKEPVPRYPLLVENREELLQKAREQNIFLGKWYDQVIAPKELDLRKVGYKIGDCPVAEEISKKIINLPTLISIKEAEKILKYIK